MGSVTAYVPLEELTDTEEAVRTAFDSGTRLDLSGRADREVRGEVLAALLVGAYPLGVGAMPALRLDGAHVTGRWDIEGREVGAVITLQRCEFEHAPVLRMARLVALSLRGCRMPGLSARNLRVGSDLLLESGYTCAGVLDLTDATVEGTLRLAGAVLRNPGAAAFLGARLRISGSIHAVALQVFGELRLRGANIGGSVRLTGATLSHPSGTALEATGLTVAGDLFCDAGGSGFDAAGTTILSGARIGGDAVFSGAQLHDARGDDGHVRVLPRGTVDDHYVLDADRLRVDGDVKLDEGFTASGTVGLRSAQIGGHLLLSGATIGHRPAVAELAKAFAEGRAVTRVPIALVADGIEVRGDVEARGSVGGKVDSDGNPGTALRAYGQVRLVDAHVHGSASLSRARLRGPAIDVLFADRLRVGGTLFLRKVRASGSIRLQNAHIGSSLDCSGAHLTKPRLRPDGTLKPSLDARVATVGKDLLCSYGFRAIGGVRIRLVEVGKMVTFAGARLGGRTRPRHLLTDKALSAYGLSAQELVLVFPERRPPQGTVILTRATVVSVIDGPGLWAATGGVEIEDFTFTALTAVPDVPVKTRLLWLRKVQPDFAPGPYERLAAVYSEGGEEELAQQVHLERQRRRYAELHLAGRLWGRLQDITVGYGYRPWLAMVWLALFWLLGMLWFSDHLMEKLDNDVNPVWNPPLLATDLLLPIIDLGQDNKWRMVGASQWISGVLIAVGWILATTAATGATRVLKRG
ncbi:oxidoreductase [Actinokineospora globicatena]|uniref:Oxidoreductase n=1 Tax=Actinokineospora globicatena TaxID=103729 RepID=A0A9W6V9N6_9PSEU|nr:oxidoreductase [Actinokineospora globicatena]